MERFLSDLFRGPRTPSDYGFGSPIDSSVFNRYDIALQPGDLIFARSEANPLARLISRLDGWFSHVGLVVGGPDGELMIVHVQEGGVVQEQLRSLVDSDRYTCVVAARPTGLKDAPHVGLNVADHAVRLSGSRTRYDTESAGLVASLLARAGKEARELGKYHESSDAENEARRLPDGTIAYSCSSFVWSAFKDAQVDLPLQFPPVVDLTPAGLLIHSEESFLASALGWDGNESVVQSATLPPLLRMVLAAVPAIIRGHRDQRALPVEHAVTPGDIYLATSPDQRWALKWKSDLEIIRDFTGPAVESTATGATTPDQSNCGSSQTSEDQAHLPHSSFVSMPWVRELADSTRFVGRIYGDGRTPIATGFIMPGGQFHPEWSDAPIVISSRHADMGQEVLRITLDNVNPDPYAAALPVSTELRKLWESNTHDIVFYELVGRRLPVLQDTPLRLPGPKHVIAWERPMTIIQCPGAGQIAVSREPPGRHDRGDGRSPGSGLFGHYASTEAGSSGSPVLDENLFVCGVHKGREGAMNKAVRMGDVLGELEQHNVKPVDAWSTVKAPDMARLLGEVLLVLLVIPILWNFFAAAIDERVIATSSVSRLAALLWVLMTFSPVAWLASRLAKAHDATTRPYRTAGLAYLGGGRVGTDVYHNNGLFGFPGAHSLIEEMTFTPVGTQIAQALAWSLLHALPGLLLAAAVIGGRRQERLLTAAPKGLGAQFFALTQVVAIPVFAVTFFIAMLGAAFPSAGSDIATVRGILSATILRAATLIALPLALRRPVVPPFQALRAPRT